MTPPASLRVLVLIAFAGALLTDCGHHLDCGRRHRRDRIVGALANLGHVVSDQTVGNILRRYGIQPAPKRSQHTTWKDFIASNMAVRQVPTSSLLKCLPCEVLPPTTSCSSFIWNRAGSVSPA